MADLNTLYSQKNQYINLKAQVIDLAKVLNASADSLSIANTSINANYQIDDERADGGEVNDYYNAILKRSSFLNGTVAPSIDNEISRINGEIEAEQRRLEEEQRRLEEERRLQEEEAQKAD